MCCVFGSPNVSWARSKVLRGRLTRSAFEIDPFPKPCVERDFQLVHLLLFRRHRMLDLSSSSFVLLHGRLVQFSNRRVRQHHKRIANSISLMISDTRQNLIQVTTYGNLILVLSFITSVDSDCLSLGSEDPSSSLDISPASSETSSSISSSASGSSSSRSSLSSLTPVISSLSD